MITDKLMKKEQQGFNSLSFDEIGDDHLFTGLETPMKPNAFDISDEEKKEKIAHLFSQIMDVMGLDLTDDSLQGTPKRVAKMYIDEIFSGLNPANKPKVALFTNKYKYNQMLVEKNITFYSSCEHHFVPIIGKAHVAYISSGNVIIDAKHLCVSSRGVKDDTSSTVTSYFGGVFNTSEKIAELQNTLNY